MTSPGKTYQKKYQWPPIGNDKIADFLDRSLSSGRLAQTYIFVGAEGLGKSTLATAFANNLLLSDGQSSTSGVNSDLYILEREPDKKNISINAVRDLTKMLSLSSFLNSYKIGVIKDAETLSLEAANALLKTLEEPKEKVIIILLTTSLESLPATIASRAQILYFQAVSYETVYDYLLLEKKLDRSEAKNLAAVAAGRPLLAAYLSDNLDDYQRRLDIASLLLSFFSLPLAQRAAKLKHHTSLAAEDVKEILDSWQRVWRDLILIKLGQPELIQHTPLIAELQNTTELLADYPWSYYSEVARQLSRGRKYLAANVSPATVLEQIVYNL